jgi:GTP-binding protein Era
MVQTAQSTLKEVDVVLMVADGTASFGAGEEYIIEQLRAVRTPVILAINKIDMLSKEAIFPIIRQYQERFDFQAIVPISALEHIQLESLVDEIKTHLEPGPQYYPEDMITDQPERLVIGEMIREKALHLTREEIPHAIAVEIEEIKTRPNEDLYVRAVIYVERESQKGIVIGAKGGLLKEIGRLAREDVQGLLGSKVYLDLWVKVKKDWRNRDVMLRTLGYKGE